MSFWQGRSAARHKENHIQKAESIEEVRFQRTISLEQQFLQVDKGRRKKAYIFNPTCTSEENGSHSNVCQ